MFDMNKRKYNKSENSDLIFFEKGCGILSREDNKKISLLVKNVINHLTKKYFNRCWISSSLITCFFLL